MAAKTHAMMKSQSCCSCFVWVHYCIPLCILKTAENHNLDCDTINVVCPEMIWLPFLALKYFSRATGCGLPEMQKVLPPCERASRKHLGYHTGMQQESFQRQNTYN